ncbi:T9SS type A sorting domain-containing protein [Sphingobacteriales bacterium CHB3]|nr:T9SS type A sorting domain-containing protein [Sphingobacteriales bacterium CHB3]
MSSHVPMGVKVIQRSLMWNDPAAEGIQLLQFRVMNTTTRTIDSAYLGFFMDADIGPIEAPASIAFNRSGFVALNTGYTENPVSFGATPVGVAVLNTYKPLDSLRFTFAWYSGAVSPATDSERYALMSLDTVFVNQLQLFDTRFLLSFGPLTLQPYTSSNPDTLDVAFAILAAMDLNQLKSRAATARNIYQTITGVKLLDDFAPREFALEQNFPNPFNPTTTIRFHIAHTSHAVVEVFDLLGRHVATLVNEELAAGSYETTLNASQLSSGVYVYRLKAGSYVSTKKALLLK